MRNGHSISVAWIVGSLLVALTAAAIAAAWLHCIWALILFACLALGVVGWSIQRGMPMRANSRRVPVVRNEPRARARRLAAQLRDVRNAAHALPDAVVLLDDENRLRWFNSAAEPLLGLRRSRDRRASLEERLGASELGRWLRDGAMQSALDLPAPTDPALRLNVTVLPFGAQQRLLLARDISAVTRLEQIRRDFVANVSHELRTPLTVIHGYLELIEPGDVPTLAPVLAEMRNQSRRMGQIVEDLLTLSRLETEEALPEERVQMVPLLATLRKEAMALSQRRHVIEFDASADSDLRGSGKYLYSAFSNLVSNAVRYTPSGGRIVIAWQRSADGVVFSVRDNGLGIPAAHLARLTERFYRISSSRSRESGGTGLGLSIVKHVLNLHGARLVIESEPGLGSTFACVFDGARMLEPGGDEFAE
jgi:two-component system phosphate regulon sensor histidine kinase PhoR